MNRILLAIALAAFAPLSFAQVTSTSQTQVQSGASAGASNNGVSLSNTFEAGDRMRYDYGTQRVEQVAPLALGGAAAGFSNENCANTTQGGVSTFWFSAAKGNAKESIRCNARRDAGVYTALASDARDNGDAAGGWKLRKMAQWKMCTATEADVEACKRLGILPNDTMTNGAEQDNSGQAIPHREAGWTNESMIDKRKAPIDGRNVDATHNP